ncbi:Cell division control [Mycena sanguinolenta]|uniref:Cell division control n=1 Tax=Mycena sanguinolenta TaxID=230812 RepID=A0A8H7CQI4_9AGAR|nr:Cell division control [Mycena sanguinolenta]
MLLDKPIRMVTIGDTSVGKTSMLVTFSLGTFPANYMPLIIDTYSADVKVKKETYWLQLVDTAGEELYMEEKAFWSPRPDVFLICFRVDSLTSFESIRDNWVPKVRHYSAAPFVIVGTQTDRRDESVIENTGNQRMVTTEEAEKPAYELGAVKYVECSSLTGNGLDNVFLEALLSTFTSSGCTSPAERGQCYERPLPADVGYYFTKTTVCIVHTTNAFLADLVFVPKVFDAYAVSMRLGSETYTFGIFDTVGQAEYDRLRPLSYMQTDVFLVCFSVAIPESLQNIQQKWFPELDHHCPRVPRIVVATQIDLRLDKQVVEQLAKVGQRPVSTAEGERMAWQVGATEYLECSAKTRQGVKEVFDQGIAAGYAYINRPISRSRRCVVL